MDQMRLASYQLFDETEMWWQYGNIAPPPPGGLTILQILRGGHRGVFVGVGFGSW